MAVRHDVYRHGNTTISQRPSDTSSPKQFSDNSSHIHKSSSYVINFQTILLIISGCICFTSGLQCIQCEGASSNHECNLNGAVETCRIEQQNCYSEIRYHGGIYTIRKGCQQEQACRAQQLRNIQPLSKYGFQIDWRNKTTRCNGGYDNSVCHHCCPFSFCNLNDIPILQSDFSCNQQFSSCRNSKWSQRVGLLLSNNTFPRCYCDLQCRRNGDCCEDHHAVCIGVLPKALRPSDNDVGATGGEYNKTVPEGGDFPLLRCISCENEKNNEACNRNGKVVECRPNERSCVSELRMRNGVKRISKYCSQSHSCKTLQTPEQSCNQTEKETTCYSCCDFNYCNVLERPHVSNSNGSCLNQFPGFPQCLKPSLARCGDSKECSGEKCHCDIDCAKFNDCCDDYDDVCRGSPPANLDWIFKEIESLPPKPNMDESNLIVIGSEIIVEGSSSGRNIFKNNPNSLGLVEFTENDA